MQRTNWKRPVLAAMRVWLGTAKESALHWVAAQASEAAQTRRQHVQSHSGLLQQSMLLQQQLTRLWLCDLHQALNFSTK